MDTSLPPPSSILDCFAADGTLDIMRYHNAFSSIFNNHVNEFNNIEETETTQKKRKIHRSIKKHKITCREQDGTLREIIKQTDT